MPSCSRVRSSLIEQWKSIAPRATRNPTVAASFRRLFEQNKTTTDAAEFEVDMQNAVTFMHSQRMHAVRSSASGGDAWTDETSLGTVGALQSTARLDHGGADQSYCAPRRP